MLVEVSEEKFKKSPFMEAVEVSVDLKAVENAVKTHPDHLKYFWFNATYLNYALDDMTYGDHGDMLTLIDNPIERAEVVRLLLNSGAKLPKSEDLRKAMMYFSTLSYGLMNEHVSDRKYRIRSPDELLTLGRQTSIIRKIFSENSPLRKRIPKDWEKLGTNEAFYFVITCRLLTEMVISLVPSVADLLFEDDDKSVAKKKVSSQTYNYIDKFYSDFVLNSLIRAEGSWEAVYSKLSNFTSHDANGLSDAASDFAEKLLLPEFGRKAKHLINSGKIDINLAHAILTVIATDFLIGERTTHVMLDLQRDWHAYGLGIDANSRTDKYAFNDWIPLTQPFKSGNLDISFVTKEADLRRLGRELDNCVASYARICNLEPVHIGIVQKEGKTISIFEIRTARHDGKNTYSLKQHMYKSNIPVESETPEDVAVKDLVAALNVKTIETPPDESFARQYRKNSAEVNRDISKICGFDIYSAESPEIETKALAGFLEIRTGRRANRVVDSKKPFVPGKDRWVGLSAAEFLEQSGLLDKVIQLASQPPLTEPEGFALGARR